jgi:hypothetical protein
MSDMWWSEQDIETFARNCWQWKTHHNAESRSWARCRDAYIDMARFALTSADEKAHA